MRDRCLKHIKTEVIPSYEQAPGLVMVWVLERPFVAYVELVLLSVWKTAEEMSASREGRTADPVLGRAGFIQLEPRTYQLVTPWAGRYARADPHET
jgi:hypothetical protein